MSKQVYKALRDGVQDVAVKKLKVDATASGVQAFLEVCPSHGRKPHQVWVSQWYMYCVMPRLASLLVKSQANS